MRAAYPFANNPYLQETVENLQPAMSRAYFLALEQRKASMSEFLELFERLLAAVIARDFPQIREVLTAYAQRSSDLVVSALTDA
jgi:DNA-binding GntR family transcriptional regulator